jgi:hypothetical protein
MGKLGDLVAVKPLKIHAPPQEGTSVPQDVEWAVNKASDR